MNWDAAEQVIELRDVQSDDKILEVGFGPGVAIQLLLHRAPARIRLRGRRVAGNGASSGGPQRPRVAQRSTSALGADEINTLMTQPGMSLLTASGAFVIRAEPSADTPLLQQQQKKGSTRG
jgi:hypothetical protein